MREQDQFDILSSDVKLVDATVRRPAGGTSIELVVPGHLFPDDRPCVTIVERLDRDTLISWCNHVRGEWNA